MPKSEHCVRSCSIFERQAEVVLSGDRPEGAQRVTAERGRVLPADGLRTKVRPAPPGTPTNHLLAQQSRRVADIGEDVGRRTRATARRHGTSGSGHTRSTGLLTHRRSAVVLRPRESASGHKTSHVFGSMALALLSAGCGQTTALSGPPRYGGAAVSSGHSSAASAESERRARERRRSLRATVRDRGDAALSEAMRSNQVFVDAYRTVAACVSLLARSRSRHSMTRGYAWAGGAGWRL